MADIMSFLDRKYLYAQDLKGDTVVEFEKVVPGSVDNKGGKKRMPMAYFKGYEKPLGLNATNCRTIGKLFGDRDAEKMPGRRVTLYVTTTETKDGMQECIRIRGTLPKEEPKPSSRVERHPTQPLPPDEAKLRKAYGAELKALAATLKLDAAAIKDRFGDLTQLTTERLGEVCADLERERQATS